MIRGRRREAGPMHTDDDIAPRSDATLEGPLIGYAALVIALVIMLIA